MEFINFEDVEVDRSVLDIELIPKKVVELDHLILDMNLIEEQTRPMIVAVVDKYTRVTLGLILITDDPQTKEIENKIKSCGFFTLEKPGWHSCGTIERMWKNLTLYINESDSVVNNEYRIKEISLQELVRILKTYSKKLYCWFIYGDRNKEFEVKDEW